MAQYPKTPSWESLVYEALVQKGGILLFVQGYHDGQSKDFDLSQMRCVFGNMEAMTWIRMVGHEVIKCRLIFRKTI
jgi:hypothetical protein